MAHVRTTAPAGEGDLRIVTRIPAEFNSPNTRRRQKHEPGQNDAGRHAPGRVPAARRASLTVVPEASKSCQMPETMSIVLPMPTSSCGPSPSVANSSDFGYSSLLVGLETRRRRTRWKATGSTCHLCGSSILTRSTPARVDNKACFGSPRRGF